MQVTATQSGVPSVPVTDQFSSNFFRQFSVIDIPYTTILRAMNYCAESCFRRSLFSEDRLLTHKDRQVKAMQKVLENKKCCDTFAHTAASFLQTALAHVAGSQMNLFPSVAGNWACSWVRINGLFGYYAYGLVGYGALYAKDRINRNVKLDATLSTSPTVMALDRLYCRIRTTFAQYFIGRGVNYSVNLKHLVLNCLIGVDKLEKKLALEAKSIPGKMQVPKRVAALIESLGSVLERHDEIDKEISKMKLDPKSDDAFIVRLEILKTSKGLPPGLPDPASIKAGELSKKRDEALLAYGKQLATWFFEKHAPDGLHRGFFGWVWDLEGEYQSIDLAASLLTEFGLRQIIDPHRLYVAILTAVGAETMELEHDKYGENSRERIFKTGREMMEQSQKSDASSYSILKIFNDSGLDSAPAGSKVIDQKQKARAQLKKVISGMIYDSIKTDKQPIAPRSLQATFNTLAEQASRLPGIGFAPIFIRGLVNGAVFTINHIREGKGTPYAMGLVSYLTGTKQTDYLADKILELIDHPSWPVIALKIVDTMIQSFSAQEQDRVINETDIIKHFQSIGTFLLHNAIVPLVGEDSKGVVDFITSGLSSGQVFEEFKNKFNVPQNVAFLETSLPFIQPTIKELELYMRTIDMFRKLGVTHKDDTKFWECYIRERLYRQVDPRIDETGKLRSTPNYGPTREKIVNDLMALDDAALRKELSSYVDMVPLPVVTPLQPRGDILTDYVAPTAGEIVQLQAPREKPAATGAISYVKSGKNWLGRWW